MILSSYDFPTLADHLKMEQWGAQSAEQCRSLIMEEDGTLRPLDWLRHRGDKIHRLRHPKPIPGQQAAEELIGAGTGHRVVGIVIFSVPPTLAAWGVEGPDNHLRIASLERWFVRQELGDDTTIAGAVCVLELVDRDGEREYAPLPDTLDTDYYSPCGTVSAIHSRPGMDAWVEGLVRKHA